MNDAKTFVEKMFSDDSFLRQICEHGGFHQKADDAEKTRLILKAAGEMGFSFTAEEYTRANEEYFKGKGAFGAIKAFWHMNRVIRSAGRK